jgi:hypothetical protein
MARGKSRGHKGGRKQFSNPDQIKEDLAKVELKQDFSVQATTLFRTRRDHKRGPLVWVSREITDRQWWASYFY